MPLYNPPTSGASVDDATISTSDITTNNASTSKHGWLKKLSNSATDYMDGTGAWSVPAGGGGGANSITQSTDATGSPAASLVWASAPANGSCLLIWGANNGSGPTAMSSTNTTWTKIATDSVGGIGDLWVFQGTVSGGAGGTTVTFTGGSGGSSALGCELAGKTYSSVAKTLMTTGTNKRMTAQMLATTAQFVVVIFNSAGGAPGGAAIMNVPHVRDSVNAINALAGGWGIGGMADGYYPTAAVASTIAVVTFA